MKRILLGLLPFSSHCLAMQAPVAQTGASAPLPLQQIAQAPAQAVSYETAAIAALGAILGVILKDLVFKLMEEYRARKATMKAVYARYADPLFLASVSLMWRLHEALEQPGRGRFLKLVGVPLATNKYSTYGAYKKLSTLYRLAVVLGWITACRREFSYLKVAESDAIEPIEAAINQFKHALADGPDVEVERLQKLCELWGIEVPIDESKCSSLAVDLEIVIDEYFQELDIEEAYLLSDEQKLVLTSRAANIITSSLMLQDLTQPVLHQSWARAIQIVDFKEAWIYRDWQSAIGDLMLRPIDVGERRFEVIGFSEFESICSTGTVEQRKWISRLSAVFDGIDLSRKNPYDHRPCQLMEVLRAAASLSMALSISGDKRKISQKSIDLAASIKSGSKN